MGDYRDVFGEEVAQGLGLGSPPPTVHEDVEDYEADPAGAFSRMAERLHLGGANPFPFATVVQPISRKSSNHSKE